jgi:hypothetical protein
LSETRTRVEQEAGLVVIKDPGIDQAIKDMFQDVRTGKAISTDTSGGIALEEGYAQGLQTNIAMGLDAGKEKEYIEQGTLKLGDKK